MLGCEANGGRAPGRQGIVGTTAAGLALIVGVVGVFIGWNARSARGAHSDVKLLKGRLPASRGARNRAGLWSLGLIVLTLLALSALIRG
jgi:hypothetical protein